ncbi:MAG: hypothetical protein HPY74_20200 [Firmicutes bacterium]|nr:hypothetical protein [Bacillota bacterium]
MSFNEENKQQEMKIPNPFEIWKKMYFATEEAISSTVREAIATQSFARMIDSMLENYLVFHKLYTETTEKWAEAFPFATKQDVARVAEIVVALEDKIDKIDLMLQEKNQSLNEIRTAITNLGKLASDIMALSSQESAFKASSYKSKKKESSASKNSPDVKEE